MTEQYLGINIDLSRDSLFDAHGLLRLKESYMRGDEASPQHRFAFVATKFGTDLGHAQRLYDYASKHWLSFSTPILSFGKDHRALPISCFLPYLSDTREGLVSTLAEVNWLSMLGGGIGVGVGIRASDNKSTGVIPHMKTYDSCSLAYRQGKTRRGSYAMYLGIDHPDILSFIEMRRPTGDQNLRCLNLHNAVNITDDFMQIIERCMEDPKANDDWKLVDPHSGEVREVVSAKALWQKILELRITTGEPYIHFIDASNRALPEHMKKLGLKIRQSNLCCEILEPTDENRTAVCCLSSPNLEYFDDWEKDPLFVQDTVEFLDNVLQYFIDNAPHEIRRAAYSAYNERSIGVGALGFHSYLQQKNIPFESVAAKIANRLIFKHWSQKVDEANLKLGKLRGEAPDSIGTGKRCSLTRAIAPNASTSIIMGNTSPSIEPYRANVYRQDTISGSHMTRNKYLDDVLKLYCMEYKGELHYDEIWSSIISHDGSVQHLEFLTDRDKEVFKTAMEIDQRWIIEHAVDRQQFIDQGQSLNLFFRPDVNVQYLHAVHFEAWKRGLKTLYYCRSEKIGKADKVSQAVERKVIEELNAGEGTCLACE